MKRAFAQNLAVAMPVPRVREDTGMNPAVLRSEITQRTEVGLGCNSRTG